MRDRQKRENMIEAFRRADKNGDGRLSVDEIYAIYVENGIEVTREEVEKIVEEADKVSRLQLKVYFQSYM